MRASPFDKWMVTYAPWKPFADASYPHTISFWVLITGIPFEFSTSEVYNLVGGSLGRVLELDVSKRRILIEIPCSKPLIFSSSLEFKEGIELQLLIEYVNLEGFCSLCYRMTHGADRCHLAQREVPVAPMAVRQRRSHRGRVNTYKGVVIGNPLPSNAVRVPTNRQHANGADRDRKGKQIAVSNDEEYKEARNASKRSYDTDALCHADSQVQVIASSSRGNDMLGVCQDDDSLSAKKVRRPLFQSEDMNQVPTEPQNQDVTQHQDDTMQQDEPVDDLNQLLTFDENAEEEDEAGDALFEDDDLFALEEDYEPTDEEVAEAAEDLRKAELLEQEEEMLPDYDPTTKPPLAPPKNKAKSAMPLRGVNVKKMLTIAAMSPRKNTKDVVPKAKNAKGVGKGSMKF